MENNYMLWQKQKNNLEQRITVALTETDTTYDKKEKEGFKLIISCVTQIIYMPPECSFG